VCVLGCLIAGQLVQSINQNISIAPMDSGDER